MLSGTSPSANGEPGSAAPSSATRTVHAVPRTIGHSIFSATDELAPGEKPLEPRGDEHPVRVLDLLREHRLRDEPVEVPHERKQHLEDDRERALLPAPVGERHVRDVLRDVRGIPCDSGRAQRPERDCSHAEQRFHQNSPESAAHPPRTHHLLFPLLYQNARESATAPTTFRRGGRCRA